MIKAALINLGCLHISVCQCFNHAKDCRYDEEIARKRLSANTNGIFEGGGVCIDCEVSSDKKFTKTSPRQAMNHYHI